MNTQEKIEQIEVLLEQYETAQSLTIAEMKHYERLCKQLERLERQTLHEIPQYIEQDLYSLFCH